MTVSHSSADDYGAPPKPGRMRGWWAFALIGLWAVLAAADLMFAHGGLGPRPAAADRRAVAPRLPAAAITGASAPPGPNPARTRDATPATTPTKTAHILAPVSAFAFGPTGTASGDNPGLARNAIDNSMATDWSSDWYRTAGFGHLQAGTGLLIDMGRQVTIRSVTLSLGGSSGTDLELLTGNTPYQATMSVRAIATGVGGTVGLRLHKSSPSRYLLVWFTLLPRDSAGTYQVSVHNLEIRGY